MYTRTTKENIGDSERKLQNARLCLCACVCVNVRLWVCLLHQTRNVDNFHLGKNLKSAWSIIWTKTTTMLVESVVAEARETEKFYNERSKSMPECGHLVSFNSGLITKSVRKKSETKMNVQYSISSL